MKYFNLATFLSCVAASLVVVVLVMLTVRVTSYPLNADKTGPAGDPTGVSKFTFGTGKKIETK